MKLTIEVFPLCLFSASCYIDPRTGRYSRKEAFVYLRNNLTENKVWERLNKAVGAWFRNNSIKCPLEMKAFLRFGHGETEKVFEMCYIDSEHFTYRFYGRFENQNKFIKPIHLMGDDYDSRMDS